MNLITGISENHRDSNSIKYSTGFLTRCDIVIIDNVLVKNRGDMVSFDGSNVEKLCSEYRNILIQTGDLIKIYCSKYRVEMIRSLIKLLNNEGIETKGKIEIHCEN